MKKLWYWTIPLLIFVFQAIYTLSSMNQIRLEEAIESFRSPWWFQNHLVWNGSYSLLGWHGLLALIYNVFGFHFYGPKFVKLGIELISYFCLALVLKRYFGISNAWLPLLVVGLSPTFLYFNSLQTSMGLDVSLFFILFYILSTINFKKNKEAMLKQGLLWSVAMFAWLTYFGFVFYLPILLAYYLYLLLGKGRYFSLFVSLRGAERRSNLYRKGIVSLISFARNDSGGRGRNDKQPLSFILKNLLFSLSIFLLPLIVMFFYINNRELLIYDPLLHRGLFRSFASFEAKPDVWFDTFERLGKDLFIEPASYYFESKKVEFSDYYPIISLMVVGGGLFSILKKKKKLRLLILSLVFLLFFYLVLIGLVGPKTLGGIRRGTVLLVIFYGLFAMVWQYVLSQKKSPSYYFILSSLGLLLIHHLITYPINVINIKKPSIFRERWWFYNDHPEKTLSGMIETVTKTELAISCEDKFRKPFQCPGLSLIYPAIAGVCYWNKLYCHKITFYDEKSKKYLPLTIAFWGTSSHTEP